MKFSSIPLLFAANAGFWIWAARAAAQRGRIEPAHVRAIHAWLALLTAWGVATAMLATTGAYRSAALLALLPGLWVPLAPVALTLALLAWPRFRAALWQLSLHTPPRAFLWLHALRIAALGGIVKAAQGLLPKAFVFAIGIPDLAFGLASLALALNYRHVKPGRTGLIAWNLAGMAVLMAAPVLMQMGLPGPFHIFSDPPDARALFEFPMVLAPTLVVTLMFFTNGWHAYVLWRSPAQGCV